MSLSDGGVGLGEATGLGETPKLERSISTISPATVPVDVGVSCGLGDGFGLGEGGGVGVGVGGGVGLGEGEGEGEGVEVGSGAVKLIVSVLDSPAGLVLLPVKRRILKSYWPGPR
mgnify:CR=1 FL=1